MDLLSVTGVSVRFGGLAALQDVTLRVPEHGVVGLIGPNGAGKTTLFNVVSGLQRADSGSVAFDGADITDAPPHHRTRLGIGRSFQNLGLVSGETVLTNVMAAEHVDAGYRSSDPVVRPTRWWRREQALRARAHEALASFGLSEKAGERVGTLSFAAARFVELACVLVQRPRLMLLDEPTTGLDVTEVARLTDVLREVRASGTTILLVAHDVRFVMQVCDRVSVLAEGQVLFEGTPREVQRNPAVVTAYLGRSA